MHIHPGETEPDRDTDPAFRRSTKMSDQNKPTSPAQDAVDNIQHLANLAEFIDAVGQMRMSQKQFFKLRRTGTQKEIKQWFDESRRLEKLVDGYLTKFKERSNQKSLF